MSFLFLFIVSARVDQLTRWERREHFFFYRLCYNGVSVGRNIHFLSPLGIILWHRAGSRISRKRAKCYKVGFVFLLLQKISRKIP